MTAVALAAFALIGLGAAMFGFWGAVGGLLIIFAIVFFTVG